MLARRRCSLNHLTNLYKARATPKRPTTTTQKTEERSKNAARSVTELSTANVPQRSATSLGEAKTSANSPSSPEATTAKKAAAQLRKREKRNTTTPTKLQKSDQVTVAQPLNRKRASPKLCPLSLGRFASSMSTSCNVSSSDTSFLPKADQVLNMSLNWARLSTGFSENVGLAR